MAKKLLAAILTLNLILCLAGCNIDSQSSKADEITDPFDFVSIISDKDLVNRKPDYLKQHGFTYSERDDIQKTQYLKLGEYLDHTLEYQYIFYENTQDLLFLRIIFQDIKNSNDLKKTYTQLMDVLNQCGKYDNGNYNIYYTHNKNTLKNAFDVLSQLDDNAVSKISVAWKIGTNYITLSIQNNETPYMNAVVSDKALFM